MALLNCSIDSLLIDLLENRMDKNKIKFYRYSFGSFKEAFDWNEKSKVRKLLSEQEYSHILEELQKLPKELNQLIKFTNQKLTI